MVRLKVSANIFAHHFYKKFQFHNGSIKSYIVRNGLTYHSCFNSTMVRLKVSLKIESTKQLPGFNSTMVRLKDVR